MTDEPSISLLLISDLCFDRPLRLVIILRIKTTEAVSVHRLQRDLYDWIAVVTTLFAPTSVNYRRPNHAWQDRRIQSESLFTSHPDGIPN